MEVNDCFKFFTPTTINITGNTGSGKTYLLFELLQNSETLFFPKPKNLIVLYSQYQSIYESIKLLKNFESITLL